jgi:hypothetical protein
MLAETLERLLPVTRVAELPGGYLAPLPALQELLAVMEALQRDER